MPAKAGIQRRSPLTQAEAPDTSSVGVPAVVPAAAAYSVRSHAGLDQIVDLLAPIAELGEDLDAVLAEASAGRGGLAPAVFENCAGTPG